MFWRCAVLFPSFVFWMYGEMFFRVLKMRGSWFKINLELIRGVFRIVS